MSAKRKNALGRGLGALLDDSPSMDNSLKVSSAERNIGSISEIDLTQIEVNPFQPRTEFDQESLQELSKSFKVQGIIQPFTVRMLSQ